MSQALLVMDIQQVTIARIEKPEPMLNNINQSIQAARQSGIPVIFVTVAFREGFPEVSDNNKIFRQLKTAAPGYASTEGTAILPIIQQAPGDVHVIKRRISAFTGSDLEVVLRAGQIKHLVLCGISTSGVVLSTVREAADKDYELTVLEDCCNDADPEVHRVLTQKVFTRQAEVITHTTWIEGLKG